MANPKKQNNIIIILVIIIVYFYSQPLTPELSCLSVNFHQSRLIITSFFSNNLQLLIQKYYSGISWWFKIVFNYVACITIVRECILISLFKMNFICICNINKSK